MTRSSIRPGPRISKRYQSILLLAASCVLRFMVMSHADRKMKNIEEISVIQPEVSSKKGGPHEEDNA